MSKPDHDQSTLGARRLARFLRQLRARRGESTRSVANRARTVGFDLSASDLSRYERALRRPGIDKLTAIAGVYGVPMQCLSEVYELPPFECLMPSSSDTEALLSQGVDEIRRGAYLKALACFARAEECIGAPGSDIGKHQLRAKAQANQAHSLLRLGCLSLAQYRIRQVLRRRCNLETRIRAILILAFCLKQQGDFLESELLAAEVCRLVETEDGQFVLQRGQALLLRGCAQFYGARYKKAIELYSEAATVFSRCGDDHEEAKARLAMASCYVQMGRTEAALYLMRQIFKRLKGIRSRHLLCLAHYNYGQAQYRSGDACRAMQHLQRAKGIASSGDATYADLLFHADYYLWRIAKQNGRVSDARNILRRLQRRMPDIRTWSPELDDIVALTTGAVSTHGGAS